MFQYYKNYQDDTFIEIQYENTVRTGLSYEEMILAMQECLETLVEEGMLSKFQAWDIREDYIQYNEIIDRLEY